MDVSTDTFELSRPVQRNPEEKQQLLAHPSGAGGAWATFA